MSRGFVSGCIFLSVLCNRDVAIVAQVVYRRDILARRVVVSCGSALFLNFLVAGAPRRRDPLGTLSPVRGAVEHGSRGQNAHNTYYVN